MQERRPLAEPLAVRGGPLRFSPDGDILGTGFADPAKVELADGRTLTTGVEVGEDWLVWDLPAWRARTCRLVTRDLTQAEWTRFFPAEPYRRTCAK